MAVVAAKIVGVQVTGLRELVKALKDVEKDIPKELLAINKAAAEKIVPLARSLAPHGDTGMLAASIRAGATRRSGTIKAGSSSVVYAPPIHWGWPSRNIAPNQFLVEALHQSESMIQNEYLHDLQVFLDRRF